jgi:hypothetical protein
MSTNPTTPDETEALAKKLASEYLTACRLTSANPADIGDRLMKLVSVAGVLMAQAEGSEVAHERLIGTGQFVRKTMPKKPAKLHAIH